jgi:hypothetical protein
MNMPSNDTDNEQAFMEDKPFSPMYPVFNFGGQQSVQPLQAQPQAQNNQNLPPSYGFADAPSYDFQEKKGFH